MRPTTSARKWLSQFYFAILLVASWEGLPASAEAIHFIEPDLHLAGLTAGQPLPVVFQLTNGTAAAIKIQAADASCGCTTLEKSPTEIPAHGVGEFEWIFDSSGATGQVSETVSVEIADGPTVLGQFSLSVGDPTSPAQDNIGAAFHSSPPGMYVHDPSTIVVGGHEHWFFSTGRGILSLHSPTLTNWRRGPRVFQELPAWVTNAIPGSKGVVWAPDIIRLGDQYFLYYAVSTWGKSISVIGLATNPTLDPDDPHYHWTDRGLVISTKADTDYNAIDPSVFHDEDGSLWLAFGSYWSGIKLIQLDPKTGLRLAPDSPVYPLACRKETNGDTSIEASCLARHGKYYYLFANWEACCRGTNSTYEIRLGRSEKITGPYLDRSGRNMLNNGGDLFLGSQGRFIGPGHAGILNENGTTWFSFHFYDGEHYGLASIAVRQLNWGADGWPVLGAFAP